MKKIFGIGALLLVVITGYLFVSDSKSKPADNQGGYGGLTVTEAKALAQSRGVMFRVTEIDGEAQAVTADYRPGRVNAEIENDVVIGYSIEN